MNKQNTKLPKWFKGQLYDKGDTVRNPFSGEEYELNNIDNLCLVKSVNLYFLSSIKLICFIILYILLLHSSDISVLVVARTDVLNA